eukprot:355760_1
MMSLLVVEIAKSSYGQKDITIVFGYIRKCQSHLFPSNITYYTIPDLVIHLCLSYYHILMDKWHIDSLCDEFILENETLITNNAEWDNDSECYRTAFLSNIIESGKHKWTFQILNYKGKSHGYNYFFGIHKISSCRDLKELSKTYFTQDTKNVYGWLASCRMLLDLSYDDDEGSCSERYGQEIKDNDIVEMCIDLYNMQLKYIINGKDYGKAFDIEKTKYRAAVLLSCQGNQIKLLPNQYE